MADHGIPAVERAVEVLEALADRPHSTISDLAGALPIPRSTIYRILNSLHARDMVTRDTAGAYALGPRLIRLARGVRSGVDLVSLARPEMAALANALNCAVKLSVLDDDAALVVAISESPQTYSVTTQVGRRFPLHAGAASKLLLAFAPADLLQRVLRSDLQRYTAATIVDPGPLSASLRAARQSGWAEDRGEFVAGVHALAAAIFDDNGSCVGALSVPYLAELPAETVSAIHHHVRSSADAITRKIGGVPRPGQAQDAG